MKRNLLIILSMLCLGTHMSRADDKSVTFVLADGTTQTFLLKDRPKVTFQGKNMVVSAAGKSITVPLKDGMHSLASEGTSPTLNGDVNGDGVVDISDVNAIIGAICGGDASSVNADVNADGNIDISDVNKVISIICGKE